MGDTISGAEVPEIFSTKEKISALEQRYIELLESKIARLEIDLAKRGQTEPVKVTESVTGDNDSTAASKGDDGDDAKNPLKPEFTEEDEQESRYHIIISKWDPDSGDFKDTDATKKAEMGPENQPSRAFTFRKLTMPRPRYAAHNTDSAVSSECTVHSKPLQKLLGKITSKWGWSDTVTSCRSPYMPLIYSWDEAEKEAEPIVEDSSDEAKKARENDSDDVKQARAEQEQARTDLRELLNIIQTSSGYLPLDRYLKDRKSFIEEGTITHSALCTLFPPGTLIVARPFLDEPQIMCVSSCDNFVQEHQTFDLVCYCFDWNGEEFNRTPFEMKIRFWGPDRRSIIELPFYPLDHHVDASAGQDASPEKSIERLKNKLIERGRNYVDICTAEKGKQMFKYNGDAHFHTGRSLLHRVDSSVDENSRRSDDASMGGGSGRGRTTETPHVSKKKIEGTTMVDFDSFFEYLSPDTPILGQLRRYDGQLESLSPERRANPIFQHMYKFLWDKHPPGKEMTNEQYMLCPPRVLGYALKQKKWAQLLVDRLGPPDEADTSVFRDKLQLDENFKDLVQKSVQAHEQGKAAAKAGGSVALEDFAPDKGKGLVIMLYGYPGVGKTLTAESVALMAGKPLLSVGVSDIGIEGDKVEANLQKVFDLAGKWEAILLFDEADVFLEARGEGENDLKRNAMVSVLLRVLEYYDGILILTTNRMKSFDIAVQSRIHIAIKFEELTPEQQVAIFISFIDQLEKKRQVKDAASVKNWVRQHGKKLGFNGRQIRNVVSTAMGVALMDEENGQKLTRDHLVEVADQTKQFKLDLKSQEEIFKRLTK